MSSDLIKLKNVSKVYKNHFIETKALDNISFIIKEGEFVAIMGPSGSGKSTLLHILGLLDKPTKGEYFFEGKKVSDLREEELAEFRNQKIGFVFQAYNLLPRVTALKNVGLPLVYAGVEKEKREKIAFEKLKIVGLEDKINHFPNQLSGGQQQRVAIARALVNNPSIILADEPTGNLASIQADEIMTIFKKLNQQGKTIILITHEEDIAEWAKRVIKIKDGKLI
ncbi:MAG: ABC transporter ATP-binding protein [Patescibacteria group bacterium]|nr:MAG: ABC transporter ATP-binding protein [Patescibacteria group bacterium]